jgi:hypothetical protein
MEAKARGILFGLGFEEPWLQSLLMLSLVFGTCDACLLAPSFKM